MERRNGIQVPYPVDARGFALPIYEVGGVLVDPDPTSNERRNNHHYNYYRRAFGTLAIANTFRNLETQQVEMVVWRHDKLHERYSGICLPPLIHMLDAIEDDKEQGNRLKIYDPYQKKYIYQDINDITLKTLHAEYNQYNKEIA